MQPIARKPYDTDLTDEQWAIVEPLLPPRKSGTSRGGRPAMPWREMLNAMLYINRAGGAWRLMPHDLPHWNTVHWRFRHWCKTGVWQSVHDALRDQVRTQDGRDASPSAAIIDSQSVKTTLKGGPCEATTPARR
jgi:transposase